jgi:uncharacterized lipoprotein YddW (UPF0748 family)
MTGTPTAARLISLDAFRGFAIASMVLVNNPGDRGKQMRRWCLRFCSILRYFFWAATLAGCAQLGKSPIAPRDAANLPPPPPREFRAAWIATVANIDWPSTKGLTVEQQKREIVRIVDRAKELKLNALIFQVRPAADALYSSALEPWSEYLTGEQGKTPDPYYDPLEMWVEEAHGRGIELHAWFNPYRARHVSAKSPNAPMHIANANPEIVKSYGGYLWMDPGEDAAAQRTLDVILDVVRRYDIDGVHVDDYFYPYPVSVPGSVPPLDQDFPDDLSWRRWVERGGGLSRADWRRRNVNRLMERIYINVHREKPWVRFGISPFGLGRPDRRPPGITGFSQYDKLYADVELWLDRGWLDYLAPQLYWPIDQPPQAFGALMEYWVGQNTAGRHIWPGLFTSRIDNSPNSWKPDEIMDEIALMRTRAAVSGHVHFSMVALMENRQGINDRLKAAYATPALTPAMPWLATERPPAPTVFLARAQSAGNAVTVDVLSESGSWQIAVWMRFGTTWRFTAIPAAQRGKGARGITVFVPDDGVESLGTPEIMSISVVDRFGNESERVTLTQDDFAKAQ